MAKPPRVWTPERIAQLQALAQEGLSLRQAALCMGKSFASIINAASALGVRFHGGRGGAPRGNKNAARPHRRTHDPLD